MDTKHIKGKTENLKKEINRLLMEYAKETDIAPDAVQAVAQYSQATGEQPTLEGYQIDLGIRL